MSHRLPVALFGLLMLFAIVIPARAWEYQDGTPSDTLFERFGPRADKLLIKLYAAAEPEWDALARGEIDMTDWALTKPYYDLFTSNQINPATGLPYNETINVSRWAELGFYMTDINNNGNQYLGNPPNPAYPNPVYPNPCSVVEMRQAIWHLTWGNTLYTVVPPSLGDWHNPIPNPYPYDPNLAKEKLDSGGFILINSPDGWRYWDRNSNLQKDDGEDLTLKFFIRSDDTIRRDYGLGLADRIEDVGVHVTRVLGSSGAAKIQLMINRDFHLYIGHWGIGIDPTYLIIWTSAYSPPWGFPSSYPNYAGINDPLLNEYGWGVLLANTFEEARTNCWLFQERWAEIAASVPLWCYAGSMAMSRYYTGGNAWQPSTPDDGENAYRGQYLEGAVDESGFGTDSFFSFLNMHPRGYQLGNGNMTIRYGFKVPDLKSLNPVYAEWTWDWNTMGMMYESLLNRNPYNLAEFMPWMAQSFQTSTYTHPVYGTCTKVRFTLRPDITWIDGTPLTIADVYFTFVELDDILAERGLPPPWWISNVQNILSFSILDAYNFEVLLDVKAVWATGWIGGNIVLPKHIWKPLAESGPMTDPGPDPNCISSGPYRFAEYVPNAYVLMYANKPGSTVTVGPSPFHTGSVPVESPKGHFSFHPVEVDISLRDEATGNALANRFEEGPDVNVVVNDTCKWLPDVPQQVLYEKSVLISRVSPNPATFVNVTGIQVILNQTQPLGSECFHVEAFDIGPVTWGFYKIVVVKNITEPSWAAQIITSIELFYATKKEDITGSTLFDEIALPTYPFKSQLPTPDIKVDIKDIAVAAKAFGAYPGHARWSTIADINGDYKIDIKDIAAIAKQFGWVGS